MESPLSTTRFDDRSRRLKEASLRLLAALGRGSRFPASLNEIEVFIARTSRNGESLKFRFLDRSSEMPLPDPEAERISVMPRSDGRIELETFDLEGNGLAGVLSPDGKLVLSGRRSRSISNPASIRAAVRGSVEADVDTIMTFNPRRLRRLVLGDLSGSGPVMVPWVALYEGGVLVRQLILGDLGSEQPPGNEGVMAQEALVAFAGSLTDDLRNEYVLGEPSIALISDTRLFMTFWRPGVPRDARQLVLRNDLSTVTIELCVGEE